MLYHFVVGSHAAAAIAASIAPENAQQEQVVVLNDLLHVGPLQKEEGQSFSALRSSFWQEVMPHDKASTAVNDLEKTLAITTALSKNPNDAVWFWMAPIPADVCAYYWLTVYLGKHKNRFSLINIAGLPFLDPNGKVFYPKTFAEILPKELNKARKLARIVTPAEIETDREEWQKLVSENAGMRTLEGGKKLAARSIDYYDQLLLSYCSSQFQKAHKVINQAMSKQFMPTGDLWLGWRLRQMAHTGRLQLQGDAGKTLRDFEVKLPHETAVAETVAAS
jgi:hypothetical protein